MIPRCMDAPGLAMSQWAAARDVCTCARLLVARASCVSKSATASRRLQARQARCDVDRYLSAHTPLGTHLKLPLSRTQRERESESIAF